MMNTQLTTEDYKVIWVVGAAERLASLGLLNETPLKLTSTTIDLYIEIDDVRDALFSGDDEVIEIFKSLVYSHSEDHDPSKDEMNMMIDLMLSFKNDRTKLVKYALSHQFI